MKSISIYKLEKRREEMGFIDNNPTITTTRPQKNRQGLVEQEEVRRELITSSYEDENAGNRKGGNRRTVMICDDERDLLLMFAIGLQTEYNVLTVDSGKGCIQNYLHEKHEGRKIDLLLLDYKLGDIMGDSVARKIKELNDVKIILISAYELDEQMISELKQNEYIVDIIQKPVSIEALMDRIVQNIGI